MDIVLFGNLSVYSFQHKEFVSNSTLTTIGVPTGATQSGSDFYADYEVYTSSDAGQSWSVAGMLSGIYYPSEIVYTGMNGSTPSYALLACYQDPVEGLRVGFYRSSDGGQNWVRENNNVFSNSICYKTQTTLGGPQAYYHLAYLGGSNYLLNYVRYVPDGMGGAAEFHNEFYKSTDNGDSWTMVSAVPVPNDDGDPLAIGEVRTLQYLGGNNLFVYIMRDQQSYNHPYFEGHVSTDGGLTWNLYSPGLDPGLDTTVTPISHKNFYNPFIGALDNGAVPGQYDVP
jgi:hypothetical protein